MTDTTFSPDKGSATSAAQTTTFSSLGLHESLCAATRAAGYETPTPIQQAAIPALLEGHDLLGCAQTGSGKTAAFALPVLHQLMSQPSRQKAVRVLVLAPTRELASQIGECFATYSKGSPLRHTVIFGGVNRNPQLRALRSHPEVLVACPGRLLDLMQNDGIKLNGITHLVLDEADRMLDMGFIHDIRKLLARIPKRRQTLLFSATMPKEIEQLARNLLQDPVKVAVDAISSTAEPITQSVYFVETKQKQQLLTHLLREGNLARTIIFTRTKHGANRVAAKLEDAKISARAIHGNKSQNARVKALDGFKSGEVRVIVATDLASRGIDVKNISHVINFDLPNISETYVHRVGRTGRAGAQGAAISFCASEEKPYLRSIERLTGQKLERHDLSQIALPQLATSERSEAAAKRPFHGRTHPEAQRSRRGQASTPRRRPS